MCAINGFTWKDGGLIDKMNRVTFHRGPEGTHTYGDEWVTLGHNRLAIIDLSPQADQPMVDASGRYVIVFNGQIYNFKELKNELTDYPFKTSGDSEVILAGYARWGKEVVKRLNGMFAFAIWDKEEKELFIARDHVGIKPFYYAETSKGFIFSSEIKGILEADVPRKLNRNSFGLYLQLLYVPGPETMFQGIKKLPAGSMGVFKNGELKIESYWDSHNGIVTKNKKESSYKKLVETQVDISVEKQLISDRPLGVYLSGGVDSSVVLDSVSRLRGGVDTFSVGFDLGKNEQSERFNADYEIARRTAKLYGANHHEVVLGVEEALSVFERAVWHMDQPISNATILPMFKLASFAKEKVTVVLGGDGGDELFGGYERYRLSLAASTYQKYVPSFLRSVLGVNSTLAKLNTKSGTDRIALFMSEKEKSVLRMLAPETQLENVSSVFGPMLSRKAKSFEDTFMEIDRKTWLVDESLAMSDSMSMSSALESRVPLLDRDLVELSARIPLNEKISLSNTKIVLKEAFRERLPKYLFSEPKRGWFSPGAKWLRKEPFTSFARELLSQNYYSPTSTLFNWKEINNMLEEHLASKAYHLNQLWAVLVFQSWAKQYKITLD